MTERGQLISLALAALSIVALLFALTSPIPQDPEYHLFVDGRRLFAVPNCWNVLSALPLLLVGVWGLSYVYKHDQDACAPELVLAYRTFFVGILLTAFGSAYYHLVPSNESLVYDRLPMTVGFAGLFSIITGEFVSARIGRRLLVPLLVIGIASVAYWAVTESHGAGDLRPYALVQFLPMLLIPVILVVYRSASGSARYFWIMIAFYVVAKLCEHFDAEIFSLGEVVSGHTLKHLFASLAPATLLYALTRHHLRPGLRESAR
ncbi:MAG: alkaline phytoceramidase [Gammaproteobacteria bacterium]|nr:alkaline phytoceramidase [Gammaproteobacteria bacterium]MDH3417585.1 alkaline phytoceramidase [Gammaproteobacteria bacterium]